MSLVPSNFTITRDVFKEASLPVVTLTRKDDADA